MPTPETLDLSIFNKALKDDYYKNAIISQLNNEQKLVSVFTKDLEGFQSGGNQVIASVKTRRNMAVRSLGDGGIISAPKSPRYEKLTIPKTYTYGSFQITGPTIKQSMKSAAAFGQALAEISDDTVESVDKFRERVLSGYGRGILALVNGAGSGTTTLTVDNALGITQATNGNRYLHPGMDIAIVDPTGSPVYCFRTIEGINTAGTQITLNNAVSAGEAPDNAYIVLAATDGTDIEHSLDLEPMGLLGMIDDGTFVATYFGVSRSNVPILNSTVIPNVGTLTSQKLQRGQDAAHRKSKMFADIHLMDHIVRREYLYLRETQFLYGDSSMKQPDYGFKGGAMEGEGQYTGTKVLPVNEFPYSFWLGLYKGHLVRTVDSEGEWINEDGAILARTLNRDVFIGQYRIFENFWSKRPNSGFRLDGVSATIDVDHIF